MDVHNDCNSFVHYNLKSPIFRLYCAPDVGIAIDNIPGFSGKNESRRKPTIIVYGVCI